MSFITEKTDLLNNLIFYFLHTIAIPKINLFTMSKMDRQLLRQKVSQRISVIETNSGVFVVFKTKCELECQFSGNISPILRFFDVLFDAIFDNQFLML